MRLASRNALIVFHTPHFLFEKCGAFPYSYAVTPRKAHLPLEESRVVESLRLAIASDKATFQPALNRMQ